LIEGVEIRIEQAQSIKALVKVGVETEKKKKKKKKEKKRRRNICRFVGTNRPRQKSLAQGSRTAK
jgi:hypothetical protein